jgi:hypothetical protein
MPRAKKTWAEKMNAKPPHHVVLEKDFAGIPKGAKLHISSPVEIAAELKTIPPGSILSIQAFRRRLAEKNKCDATCPVSTSIWKFSMFRFAELLNKVWGLEGCDWALLIVLRLG